MLQRQAAEQFGAIVSPTLAIFRRRAQAHSIIVIMELAGEKFFDILGKQVVKHKQCAIDFKIFKANKGAWWMPRL